MQSSHTKLSAYAYMGSTLGVTSRQKKPLFSENADFDRSLYEHRRLLAGSGSQQTWELFLSCHQSYKV